MHQNVLCFIKMSDLIPCKDFIFRQCMAEGNNLFPLFALLFIHIVCQKHINLLPACDQFSECLQYLIIGFLFDPVITIHHLEKQACCTSNTGIDGRSMPAVLLMDHLDDRRVFLRIGICHFSCAVGRTVIYDQDLYIFSPYEQGLHTSIQIILRVVTGYCYC